MKKSLFVPIGIVALAASAIFAPSQTHAEETLIRPTISYGAATVHRIQIDISWNDAYVDDVAEMGGVDYYTVRYGKKQHLPAPDTMVVDGSEDAFVISGLRSGSHYYVDVTAHFNNGDTSVAVGTSNNSYQRSTSLDRRLYTKQRRPRFLKVKNQETRQVTLKWKKPGNNPEYTRYRVKVYKKKPNKSGYKLIYNEFLYEYNTFKVDVTNLEPDTKYYYKIKAKIFDYEWTNYSDRKYFRTLPAI